MDVFLHLDASLDTSLGETVFDSLERGQRELEARLARLGGKTAPSHGRVVCRPMDTQPLTLEENHQVQIFRSRCTIMGRVCNLIVDGESCNNVASSTLIEKLALPTQDHPNPYKMKWLSNGAEMSVSVEHTDKISSLPDELLGYMLSFLPTKCAVGTSILTSRWRCLHMFTNCLSFSLPYKFPIELEEDQTRRFTRFVNRVLLLHKVSPIKKFSFDCSRYIYDDFDVHTWISAMISKGVEQLHLSFNRLPIPLPHGLFSYGKIVELKLSFIDDLRVPESTYLPNLKILHLCGIRFFGTDSFQKLFSACSVLQDLEVDSCRWPPSDTYNHVCLSSRKLKRLTLCNCVVHFEVDAPNLVYLHYLVYDVHVHLSLKNADHLITAILDFLFTNNDCSFKLAALALIKAVYHVEELQLLGDALQVACSSDDNVPTYPNMVKLHLGYCRYHTWKYVSHLLNSSTRLETLILKKGLISYTSRKEEWPLNIELVPFSSGVKVIEAVRFRGYKSELVLAKYLLANAEVLQRLALYRDRDELSINAARTSGLQ